MIDYSRSPLRRIFVHDLNASERRVSYRTLILTPENAGPSRCPKSLSLVDDTRILFALPVDAQRPSSLKLRTTLSLVCPSRIILASPAKA